MKTPVFLAAILAALPTSLASVAGPSESRRSGNLDCLVENMTKRLPDIIDVEGTCALQICMRKNHYDHKLCAAPTARNVYREHCASVMASIFGQQKSHKHAAKPTPNPARDAKTVKRQDESPVERVHNCLCWACRGSLRPLQGEGNPRCKDANRPGCETNYGTRSKLLESFSLFA
ncbi:hypothetical protein K469DRAFT_700616 [Zopfia rhizophila CBS 207.26]|uniref:Uncharacterized protein n=1 Tax=Zopfia rhizophila CBS 207.26 TaxID=1314779 RepID=A0A6A6EC47_9PEZI|nr:hypothetical protein K469DRAFT_700616 [Zopfia rhizophila CBS 207.26]